MQKRYIIYEFDNFQLDLAEQTLKFNDENVTLTPKVFDLLAVLVENHGHLLSKDELVKALWAESFVEEANLNVTVSALRKVLGEKPNENRFIETIPRRGYRFVAEVREISGRKTDENYRLISEQSLKELGTMELDLWEKHCPKCRKIYFDKTLNFCLNCGETLVTSAEISPNKTNSGFRSKRSLFYLLGGLMIILSGILIWKFAYQADKTDVSNVRTIAVLPFKPLNGKESDGALEMGMADTLITKLSKLNHIIVRPTSSSSIFSEGNTDPLAVGRDLQVEAVLDGKVQHADNKIRMTVQLLRVSDGATLWAESFDDSFTNIFAVQDSISEKVTISLAMKISSKEKELLAKRDTENTEAYSLYLQARFFNEKNDIESSHKALEYFQSAIDKDPNYAKAYASRSSSYLILATLGDNREENQQKARDTVIKALSLDPNLGEGYRALADIQALIEWNFTEAEKNYRKAIEIAPNEADTHLGYANFLSSLGRHDEAIKEVEKAVQINPVAPYILTLHVEAYVLAHRFDEAIALGKKYFELIPNDPQIVNALMVSYLRKDAFAEAEALLPRFLEINPNSVVSKAAVYLKTGKHAEGEKILRERLATYKEGDNCFQFAFVTAMLGDKEKTLEFLEKAVQQREQAAVLLAVAPNFDNLHSEPRFQELLRRVGFPQVK
jgi:DNA-binding winged helix-turn-helix (wHTH) protein/TolB-like protein/tetratricopeptide (TPR) repeat protein